MLGAMPQTQDAPLDAKTDSIPPAPLASDRGSRMTKPGGITELEWFQNMVDSNWAIVKELQVFISVTSASNERSAAATERAIRASHTGYLAVIVLAITMLGSWGLIYVSAIRNAEARETVLQRALEHCMRPASNR